MIDLKTIYIPQDAQFTIGNMSFLSVERTRGYRISFSEGRSQHAFLYTFKGSMRYNFLDANIGEIIAMPGELVFIPSGAQHTSTYLDDENEVGIAQFDLIHGEIPNYLTTPSLLKIDNSEEIFSSLNTDLKTGSGNSSMYFAYRMYELLWKVSHEIQEIPYKFRKLQTIIKEINLNYSDHLKVSDYADMIGMSEPGFRRLFTEYTGSSPIEYRNRIRLEEAKKLLRSGEYRIEEASQAVGFSNLSFFCRAYKHRFGHSPGKQT